MYDSKYEGQDLENLLNDYVNGALGGGCVHITTTPFNLVPNKINYLQLDNAKMLAVISFADSPTYEDIMAGKLVEYRLLLFYNRAVSVAFPAAASPVSFIPDGDSSEFFKAGRIYDIIFTPTVISGNVAWLSSLEVYEYPHRVAVTLAGNSIDGYEVWLEKEAEEDITVIIEDTGEEVTIPAGETFVFLENSMIYNPAVTLRIGNQEGIAVFSRSRLFYYNGFEVDE